MKGQLVLAASILLLSSNFAVGQVMVATNCSQKTQATLGTQRPLNQQLQSADPYQTAYQYVVTFYPRWFTWQQGSGGPCNSLIGPDRISPIYQSVVAINDDTLYTSAFIGAADEPVIVTIPVPDNNEIFSVLHLDQYGTLVLNGMSGTTMPGVYGIVGPNWAGTLPTGITRVDVPYNFTELLFRADKFSPTGINMTSEAQKFRRTVRAQGLSEYLKNPKKGATDIAPERVFSFPFKTFVDALIAAHPIVFLLQLQEAVASPTTQPLSQDEQTLSDTFDALFSNLALYPQLAAGAQAGHEALINNYLSNQIAGSTWITFSDIANWDLSTFQGYLNRASITQYCQYCNNHNAAAYFHTFSDANREALNGSLHSYVLTFAKGQQPEADRFWSLTAYTPEAIELVPNKADKYEVARYTPGLVTAQDGSVSILMSTTLPEGFPEANWLPVPSGPFNIMLRDYGPTKGGSVDNGTYVPPPVVPQ
jgi:hypothetical protein